jgi:hypothetical protein
MEEIEVGTVLDFYFNFDSPLCRVETRLHTTRLGRGAVKR